MGFVLQELTVRSSLYLPVCIPVKPVHVGFSEIRIPFAKICFL
jgi:hypothetical protein